MLKLGPHIPLTDAEKSSIRCGQMGRVEGFRAAGEMPQNLPALIGASMASGIADLTVKEFVESLTNTRRVAEFGDGIGTPQR